MNNKLEDEAKKLVAHRQQLLAEERIHEMQLRRLRTELDKIDNRLVEISRLLNGG